MLILAKSTKIILGTIIFLFVVQVSISARLTTMGKEVALLEEKYEKKNFENAILEQKIASSSSLTIISEKAQNLGFHDPEDILFLRGSFYFVQK